MSTSIIQRSAAEEIAADASDSIPIPPKPDFVRKRPVPQPPHPAASGAIPPLVPDDAPAPRRSWGVMAQLGSAYLISMIVHGAILLAMWFLVVPAEVREEIYTVLLRTEETVEPDIETEVLQIEQPLELNEMAALENPVTTPLQGEVEDTIESSLNIDQQFEAIFEADTDALIGPAAKVGDTNQGRSRGALVGDRFNRGATAESDIAVARALEWIQSVQREDGSWSFSEIGKSSQPGTLKNCPNGATALALMAFLGAGHTHTEEGKYQQTVDRGLNYLLNNYQRVPAGLDFRGTIEANEGMYVQGLVGIALCEAYGMSGDRRLRRAAEGALQFIMNAQDPKGGGWRYKPHQAGDTSVVGWELMALKSGSSAKIPVPRNIIAGCNTFLDSVASADGAKYAYLPRQQPKASTTAIGLLCRMYLGWKPEKPALTEGIKYLGKTGPSRNDMYYNYYATQAMIQWTNAEGELWKKWNTAMRTQLVKTQKTQGSEKGSWDVADTHGRPGGRLYMTCLAAMTLEVYYRVLPIYQRGAVNTDL